MRQDLWFFNLKHENTAPRQHLKSGLAILSGALITLVLAAASPTYGETKPSPLVARGRTGPVGLELALLKNQLKEGEHLAVKIQLKNFIKKPFHVLDMAFRGADDLGEDWFRRCTYRDRLYLEIQDSSKKNLVPIPFHSPFAGDNPFEQTVSTVDEETSRKRRSLESSGISQTEIDARMDAYEQARKDERRNKKYPAITLGYMQSATSVSWCPTPRSDIHSMSCPNNGYIELPFFVFERPGRYRVRAVRDDRINAAPKWRDLITPWNVRAATDWIEFEVVR